MQTMLLAMALSSCVKHPPVAETGAGRRVVLVGCGVSGAGRLVLDTGEMAPWTAEVAPISGGLVVELGPSSTGLAGGQGFLVLDDNPPFRVAWDPSQAGLTRCRPEVSSAPNVSFVEGKIVLTDDGAAAPEITGCGGWTRADDTGNYRMPTLAAGPCGVYARSSTSAPWQLQGVVEPRADVTTFVGMTSITTYEPLFQIEASSQRVIARRSERGFRVGDVVVSVDDVDLTSAADPLKEVRRALTRCPGIAQFVVERSGQSEAISIACGML